MAPEALSYDLKYKIFHGKHAPGDNTMSHNTFHGHPGSYEICIFGMHGMGVFTEPPLFLLDQTPVYPKHPHSTISLCSYHKLSLESCSF